jgi:hypothetical protein
VKSVPDFPAYAILALTLSRAFDELIERGDTIVWQISMICHRVETRAWSSLIGSTRCFERILTGGIDVLRFGVERWSESRELSLLTAGARALLLKVLQDAWICGSYTGECKAEDGVGLHIGQLEWRVCGLETSDESRMVLNPPFCQRKCYLIPSSEFLVLRRSTTTKTRLC